MLSTKGILFCLVFVCCVVFPLKKTNDPLHNFDCGRQPAVSRSVGEKWKKAVQMEEGDRGRPLTRKESQTILEDVMQDKFPFAKVKVPSLQTISISAKRCGIKLQDRYTLTAQKDNETTEDGLDSEAEQIIEKILTIGTTSRKQEQEKKLKKRQKRGLINTKDMVMNVADYDAKAGITGELKVDDVNVGMQLDVEDGGHTYSATIVALENETIKVRFHGFQGDKDEYKVLEKKNAKLYSFQYHDPHHPIQMVPGWNSGKVATFIQELEKHATAENIDAMAKTLKSQRNKCPASGGIASPLYARALKKSRQKVA